MISLALTPLCQFQDVSLARARGRNTKGRSRRREREELVKNARPCVQIRRGWRRLTAESDGTKVPVAILS